MSDAITIYATKGCGSAIVEAFFTLADIAYERIETRYADPGPERDELLKHNPLGQVPTLILPDRSVLTESLATVRYTEERNPAVGLIPKDSKNLARFLRWSTFLVTAIYPTFTYGDEPEKWVKDEAGAKQLRASTDEWRKKLWLIVEGEAEGPYFLGKGFSAIDIYIKAMLHWRPGREWFIANTPKLNAIFERVSAMPELKPVWDLNFNET